MKFVCGGTHCWWKCLTRCALLDPLIVVEAAVFHPPYFVTLSLGAFICWRPQACQATYLIEANLALSLSSLETEERPTPLTSEEMKILSCRTMLNAIKSLIKKLTSKRSYIQCFKLYMERRIPIFSLVVI